MHMNQGGTMSENSNYTVLDYRELVVTDFQGKLDVEKTLQVLSKIVDSAQIPDGYNLLFDLRHIQCDMSTTDIFEIINYLYYHKRVFRCKIALLLSTTTNLVKETLLKACMALRGIEVKLFFEEQNALSWLSPMQE